MTATRLPSIGSGWFPTAYCANCHAPFRQELPVCPECGHLPSLRAVETRPEPAENAEMGYSTLTAVRAGQVEATFTWPSPSLCDCTDCGRNQPLMNCPHCRGEGQVNHEAQ